MYSHGNMGRVFPRVKMKQSIFVFLLLIFFCSIGYVQSDCFSPSTDNPYLIPKPSEVFPSVVNYQRQLSYCTWYNSLTCCTNSPTLQVNFTGSCDLSPSKDCTDYLTLYYCRFCSPLYSDYVDSHGIFR